MNARSKPSSQKTSTASCNSMPSPELVSGAFVCAELVGPMIDLFGQAPVPAGPLAPRGSEKVLMTRATFGRNGFGSSASAGLACSLASNLRMRTRGSILFSLTWRASVTPSGRLIYRLRASEARTGDSALASWPTPTTPSGGQSVPHGTTAAGRRPDGSKATVTLENVACLSGWATPTTSEGTGSKRADNKQGGESLRTQALLAAWPTPMAGSPGTDTYNEAGNTDSSRKTVALLIGSSAETPAGGRLNPAHARWLMRVPLVWDACAVTAMPSTSKRSRT